MLVMTLSLFGYQLDSFDGYVAILAITFHHTISA
jgi:hypothetical protein